MKKKPSWFLLKDLFALAGPGVATLGLGLYGLSSGFIATEATVMLAVVGLAFIGIWIRILFNRKQTLSEYHWYPTYGFMVHDDGGKYHLPGTVLFEASVWRTIQAWAPYYNADFLVKGSDIIWVYFKKDLDENDKNPANKKVNGVTIGYSHTTEVDYDSADQPLERTAFEHELGHLIMGWGSGSWDEEVHHDFMKKHGLR